MAESVSVCFSQIRFGAFWDRVVSFYSAIQLRMVFTVSKVISVLEKSKLWSLGLWVLFMMTDQKVTPDTITHNAAISRGPQVLKTTLHHLGRICGMRTQAFVDICGHSLYHHTTCSTQLSVPAAPNDKCGCKVLVDHTGNTVWPYLQCSVSEA